MKKLLLNISLCCLFIFAFSSFGFACVCATVENADQPDVFKEIVSKNYEKSQAVFSGKIIRADLFKVYFAVESVWKGNVTKEFAMSTGAIALDNDQFERSSCDFSFDKEKSYLVFAGKMPVDRKAKTDLLYADFCGGTGELKDAEKEINLLNEIKTPEIFKDKKDNP